MVEYFRTRARALLPDMPPDATVVDSSSRLVSLSGVQGWDENTRFMGGDAADQTRTTMRNLEGILHELGGSLSDLASIVIYVVTTQDPDDLDDPEQLAMNKAWNAYVEVMGERQPATTLVGVTMLGGGPERLVEIEGVAALP